MTASASDPTLWADEALTTPPVAWEFLAADERWWFSEGLPGAGVTSEYWIEASISAWPATIEMTAQMTEAPTDLARPLVVTYIATSGVFSETAQLLSTDVLGTYPLEIDTSAWPTDADLTLRITVSSQFGWETYQGTIAMLGPGGLTGSGGGGATDLNCECEEENDNLTLAEYRAKLLIRAGFAAVASNPPPGVAALFNAFLQDAQAVLYRKYPALETRRFFSWDVLEGVRFYGLRDDTKEGCEVNLEPYKNIDGAWLVDLNGAWIPMVEGIPPTFYTTVNQPGLPVRFEIRQCIEIFPAPQVDGYQLVIKGHFGKRAFTADTDKPTMNGELVYMYALANALDYYGKPSAALIATQAQDLLGQLVAGTHGAKRYVPGVAILPPAVMPIWNDQYLP